MFKLFLLLSILCVANAAKILAIIPTASFSHQIFYRPLWKALAESHELTLITTDPMNDPTIKNIREIDVSIAYKINTTIMDLVNINNKFKAFETIVQIYLEGNKAVINHPEVKQLFKNPDENFDLLIIEYVYPTSFIFKHRFNVPFIGVASFDVPRSGHPNVGNPAHPILYPSNLLPTQKNMNFLDRLTSVLFWLFTNTYSQWSVLPRVNKIIEEAFGPGLPDVDDLAKEVDMVFTNDNPLFNAVRPHSPATVSIGGGLHEVALNPLPKDIQDFLDSATNGAIYFSLGTNVKSKDIASETRQTIIETFRQLANYKILWKFEDEELPGRPENVKIAKWVPQQDILRHKNVKVFVTQGGLQSLEEALYARMPVVCMPFFADQFANCRHVSHKSVGVEVNFKELTVEGFKADLFDVISNSKYRDEMKRFATIIQDQPMKPLQKAVWWIEYVLRHGGAKHLHGPKIPTYQVYYFDVFAFLYVSLALATLALLLSVRKLFNVCQQRFCKSFKPQNKKKKKNK